MRFCPNLPRKYGTQSDQLYVRPSVAASSVRILRMRGIASLDQFQAQSKWETSAKNIKE